MFRVSTLTVALVVLGACSSSQDAQPADVTSTTVAAPTSTTTTTVPQETYRVQAGDTLTAIANEFRVSPAAIIERNKLEDPDHLTEGQELIIPAAPPLELQITPPDGEPGQHFELTLTGARPGETVRFTIVSPAGEYTGSPHDASASGEVSATYQSDLDAPAGEYTVTANGTGGTTVQADFNVTPTTVG